MSQLQYTNEHQNFISNSAFQFIKKTTTTTTKTNKETNKKTKKKQNEMVLQAHGFYLFEANQYRIKLMLIDHGNLYKQTMTMCTSNRITGAKQNIEED